MNLRRQRRPAAWLAQEICCDRTNVYKIFHRASIDTELLLRISNVLKRNFFDVYTDRLFGLTATPCGHTAGSISRIAETSL